MYGGKYIRSGGNAKTIKGDKLTEFETAIMYLAPADASGVGNVCPMAVKAGCKEACLYSAGRAGIFPNIPKGRIRKTREYFANRTAFMLELAKDIQRFVNYCDRKGVKAAVRLNGTSDIQWERGHMFTYDGVEYTSIFEAFPHVEFYDYTKIPARLGRGKLPFNYSLTLSYSEANHAYSLSVLDAAIAGQNIAVVFRSKARVQQALENGFLGLKTLDGDTTDLRFLDARAGPDEQGYVIALYAKGKAKTDTTGFVVG